MRVFMSEVKSFLFKLIHNIDVDSIHNIDRTLMKILFNIYFFGVYDLAQILKLFYS